MSNQLKTSFFWKLYLLEVCFFSLFSFLVSFLAQKVYGVIVTLQGLGDQLGLFEGISGDNVTLEQAQALTMLLGSLEDQFRTLALSVIFFALVLFLIYILFQSVSWNLILIKNFVNLKGIFFNFKF